MLILNLLIDANLSSNMSINKNQYQYTINSSFDLIILFSNIFNHKLYLNFSSFFLIFNNFTIFINNSYYFYWNNGFIYGLKFIISILFLIFIRAGIPRYRYDYLTLLGWNRFFFVTLFIFSIIFITYIIN